MILLVSGAISTLRGLPADAPAGHLVTPFTGNSLDEVSATGRPWAADNGCFTGLDERAFFAMVDDIARVEALQLRAGGPRRTSCLWVTVPDAVGDAAETLRLWRYYHGVTGASLRQGCRPRLAFVAQDGSEAPGMVPWGRFVCLFIGGSTEWKEGPAAASLMRAARRQGVRVHVGRVNTERRLRLLDDLGRADDGYPLQIDSVDGTQFSRFPDTYIPRWMERLRPSLRGRLSAAPSTLPLFAEEETRMQPSRTHLIVALYIGAIAAANLILAAVGAWASPLIAFTLIAFDLVARDTLHDAWRHARGGVAPRMGALIVTAGLLSYALNPAASHIALASVTAFIAAGAVDALAYHALRARPWLTRANGSNLAGAAVDSLVFGLLAFVVLAPAERAVPLAVVLTAIVPLQLAAKVAGGAVWSVIFQYAGINRALAAR